MPLDRAEKQQIIADYAIHEGDTGSAQVQIAMLTKRINQLIAHHQIHRHDFQARRGLLKLVGRRRRLLAYLRRTQPEEYTAILERLKLRR